MPVGRGTWLWFWQAARNSYKAAPEQTWTQGHKAPEEKCLFSCAHQAAGWWPKPVWRKCFSGYMKAWEGQFSTNEVEQQKVEAKYAWIKETLKKSLTTHRCPIIPHNHCVFVPHRHDVRKVAVERKYHQWITVTHLGRHVSVHCCSVSEMCRG